MGCVECNTRKLDMEKACNKCGIIYLKSKYCSKKDWGERKYCSQSCSNSVNSTNNSRCKGKVSPHKGKKFPERSGKNNPFNTRIVLNCIYCNNTFEVCQARFKANARFCSKKCFYKYSDKGISPKNEKVRKSLKYKKWRQQVFERDNYTCQFCKNRGGKLNADHIKPFSIYVNERFDLNNGRTLCEECHRKTPTYGISLVHKTRKKTSVVTEA